MHCGARAQGAIADELADQRIDARTAASIAHVRSPPAAKTTTSSGPGGVFAKSANSNETR
jgi:hypothetical protein